MMLDPGCSPTTSVGRAMRDEDGPAVAIPRALDHAVTKLRESGAPIGSWATFIHVGA
jgi:hypothetical protein